MKLDRITMNPEVVNGQPCIRHMRLPVKRVIEALGTLKDWHSVMQEYPGLEEEDIRQSLVWAAYNLDDQILRLNVA